LATAAHLQILQVSFQTESEARGAIIFKGNNILILTQVA